MLVRELGPNAYAEARSIQPASEWTSAGDEVKCDSCIPNERAQPGTPPQVALSLDDRLPAKLETEPWRSRRW
jgi:hypothetical protein